MAAALFVVAGWVLVSNAHAYLYWANNGVNGAGTTLGRATIGGGDLKPFFIAAAKSPKGVAVGGGYVYWCNYAIGTIGRAKVDGTQVNQSFITGVLSPQGVAVDDTHIYWANQGGNAIGRASLDGTGMNQSFIPATADPYGVAVDATYVYWASSAGGAIGRANKADGSAPNHVFISPAGLFPDGVAVTASHIYWANYSGGSIGRAKLNGTGVDDAFIPNVRGPSGIAVDGSRIYWSNYDTGAIGISTLAGTGVNPAFISGASNPWGIAVDGLGDMTAAALDTTKPVARLFGSRNQDVDRLAVRVRSSEAGLAAATGTVKVRRGGKTRTLSFRTASVALKASANTRLRLKLKRADLRAVKRAIAAGQTPRVRVSVIARDGANNASAKARRTIRLRN